MELLECAGGPGGPLSLSFSFFFSMLEGDGQNLLPVTTFLEKFLEK